MPREIRQVIFAVEEVVAALRDYAGRSGRPLPFAVRAELAAGAEGKPAVRLVPAGTDGAGGPARSFAGDALLAPLLLHCRRRRIPLPVRAEKRLDIVEGELALILSMRQ